MSNPAGMFTLKVRRAFSAAAPAYETLAGAQRDIGAALLNSLPSPSAGRMLDVGCGTGTTLREARRRFPAAQLIGLDLSEGMLAQARQNNPDRSVQWVQGDARALPFRRESIDNVLSNLAYQWVDEYDLAFAEVNRVLVPGGTFAATLFGEGTCRELFESFHAVSPEAQFKALPGAGAIHAALSRQGFGRCTLRQTHFRQLFDGVKGLLGWLKGTGANNLGQGRFFLGKRLLARLEEHYRRNHADGQGIYAGFDVIWINGVKA